MRFTFLFSAENNGGLERRTKYEKDKNYLEGIILQ